MRIFALAAFALLLFPAQDDFVCEDCHRSDAHVEDFVKCPECGKGTSSCCLPYCCNSPGGVCTRCKERVLSREDTKTIERHIGDLADEKKRAAAEEELKKIGEAALPLLKAAVADAKGGTRTAIERLIRFLDWPEGKETEGGLRIAIKTLRDTVKVGEEIEVLVRITNPTKKEWSGTCHAYSHGGFAHHTYWTATRGKTEVSNSPNVMYACPQVVSHTSRRGTLRLAPGASTTYAVKVGRGYVSDPDDPLKKGTATGEPGEVTITVTEWALPATSNAIRVKVRK